MTFTKRLRDGIRRGEITCSVRIWMRPHVTVGKRYRMEEGEIEVDSVNPDRHECFAPDIFAPRRFRSRLATNLPGGFL